MSHVSDTLRNGAAYYAPAAQSDGGELGFAMPKLAVKEFGVVATLDADGICVGATATQAKTLSATGALVSGGVVTNATPRNVTITCTGNNSGDTFTVTGTDYYGQAQTENITGPNNATVAGVKAFKTITSVSVGSALSGAVNVGTGDVYGLPWHLANKGQFLAYQLDGAVVTPTVVAGFSTTGTSTATTADVRGTVTCGTASNGSRRFTAMMLVTPDTKANLYGAAPA